MPNCSPRLSPNRPTTQPHQKIPAPVRGLRRWAQACLLLAATCTISAQTLARPGWAGSGLNADPWWKHAVFCEIQGGSTTPPKPGADSQTVPGVDFKAVTTKLDALQSLGVDALLLPIPKLPVEDQSAVKDSTPSTAADPKPGADATLDSFDELVRQASARHIRILLIFSAVGVTADLPAMARFWLSRGVAGFRIIAPPETSPQQIQPVVQLLRQTASSAVGERIVIADFNPDVSSNSYTPRPRSARRKKALHADRDVNTATAQLQIDSRLNELELPGAANVRPLLEQSLFQPNVLLDFHAPSPPTSPDPYPALTKVIAAIQLTTHSAALIDADHDSLQSMIEPASDAAAAESMEWYRHLNALRHSNATLRYGRVTILNFDAQNALVWIARPSPGAGRTPPVVVACNLSSAAVQISLGAATRKLRLRGSYLRTLPGSDAGMGAHGLNSLTLPPFAVYIGELRR